MTVEGGWLVLLIGGHSGAGKSTLAADVARRSGAAWMEVDDVRLALHGVTTEEQLPAVHYFTSEPGVERAGIWERDPGERVGEADVRGHWDATCGGRREMTGRLAGLCRLAGGAGAWWSRGAA